MISAKTDGFDELEDALNRAAADAAGETRKVVSRGAVQIKRDWRRRWSGLRHARALPRAIDYDLHGTADWVAAEIGPDKDKRQGALGNLIEFGSINNAPIPGGAPALEAETPKFEKALDDLAVKLIR